MAFNFEIAGELDIAEDFGIFSDQCRGAAFFAFGDFLGITDWLSWLNDVGALTPLSLLSLLPNIRLPL